MDNIPYVVPDSFSPLLNESKELVFPNQFFMLFYPVAYVTGFFLAKKTSIYMNAC